MIPNYFNDGLDDTIKEQYSKPRKRQYLKISAPSLNFIFQADLFFFKNKVILTVIDIYSRQAYAQSVGTKTAENVLIGFKKVIEKMGKPKVLMIDGGKEFQGEFLEYLKKNGIEKRISEGNSLEIKEIKTKQGIVERYNRTILSLLKRYLEINELINFGQDDLDILNENYNNHKHSSIGYTPNQIRNGAIPKERKTRRIKTFEIGESVRLLLQTPKISKNSKTKRTYSKEVYYIISFKDNTFQLSNKEWYPYTRLKRSTLIPTVWVETKKKERMKPVIRRSARIASQPKPLRRSARIKQAVSMK